MISKGALREFQKVLLSHKTAVEKKAFFYASPPHERRANYHSLLQHHSETIDIPPKIPFS